MSYAQPPRPRPAQARGKRNLVKNFVQGRRPLPIQATLAPRPLRVRPLRVGLGDYETYTALRDAMAKRRAVAPARGRMMGQLENHSDYEYGMGDQSGYEYADLAGGGFGDDEDYQYVNVSDGSLGNWFTDILNVGPKFYVPGVTTAPPPDAYNAWRAQVMARGHTIGRWPTGPQAGELAEMSTRADGVKLYGNAPAAVIEEDHKITAFNQQAASIAHIPETIVEKAGSVVGAAGAAGRKAIGDTLGIPRWLFPVLVIGGGYIALKSVLPR
jgi:hypothetical protein